MAGHLSRGNFDVCVYNRTTSKAQAWAEQYGGRFESSPRAAVSGADLVFMCVGNDADVRQVVTGVEGALAGMASGSILVDHTTTSAQLARELGALCDERGVAFLDAPISGGQAGAENGQLTVMLGGEEAAFLRAKPAIDCYSKMAQLIGPRGSGQLCKMVNQICVAGLLQGLSEGLRFGERAGLDMQRVVDVISKGAAQSWQMDHRATTMLARQFDFGFAVDWMRKDLGFCLSEAERNGSQLEITRLVDERYAQVQAAGGHRLDTSSLIKLL